MCVVSVYGAASMLLDQLHRHFPEPRRAGQVTLKPAFYMYTIVHIKNINIQFFITMKKLFLLTCMVLTALVTMSQTKKVAILEVVDREGKMSYSTKMMLRSNMARAVANTIGYEAYDRSDVDAIMSEQDFQRTGWVSDTEIRKLGEMTGVSLILVTEGVLTGNSIFVSAKILNVETAKVEIVDNATMGLDASSMQQGCAQLAKRLFGATNYSTAVEKYSIQRMGANEYMYAGTYMDRKAYEQFLRENCPQAYKKYNDGKKWYIAGWSIFGAGMALTGVGIGMLVAAGNSDYDRSTDKEYRNKWSSIDAGGEALVITGPVIAGLAFIPIGIGHGMRNNAYKTYNKKCASSSSNLTFGITAGKNGIGLAMKF